MTEGRSSNPAGRRAQPEGVENASFYFVGKKKEQLDICWRLKKRKEKEKR